VIEQEGRRYEATDEFRVPEPGEFWLNDTGRIARGGLASYCRPIYRDVTPRRERVVLDSVLDGAELQLTVAKAGEMVRVSFSASGGHACSHQRTVNPQELIDAIREVCDLPERTK